MTTRKIVGARADGDGDITHIQFEGNQRFTSVERAIPMADRGEIEHSRHDDVASQNLSLYRKNYGPS